MEKVNQILINIQSSIQYIVDAVIGLAFQPLYTIVAIIQALIEIWTTDDEEDKEEDEQEEPQPNVTTYSSPNDGCRGPEDEWECDYPLGRIGFKINQKEQDEINRIKKELNK